MLKVSSVFSFVVAICWIVAPISAKEPTFDELVAAQRAIEQVYWNHRLWPGDNPKPALKDVLSDTDLRAKLTRSLARAEVVQSDLGYTIARPELQAEVQRMIRESHRPDVLEELFAALGRDPVLVELLLARPLVVEQLATASSSVEPAEPTSCELWRPTATVGAPVPRAGHTAIWTGAEMIVWGGLFGVATNAGGRYDPATNGWTPTSTVDAPGRREQHTAVWTGTKMIVWGGYGLLGSYLADGGRYDVTTDTWTPTTVIGAPSIRGLHVAVWTGSEMLVWGGCHDGQIVLESLVHRYRPDTDSWSTSSSPGLLGQCGVAGVWSGSEMLLFGGIQSGIAHRYAPATDTWNTMSSGNRPFIRSFPSAIWTGTEMIVWGGDLNYTNTGGRYAPSTDTWVLTPLADAPVGRTLHSAVWTGSEMIIWGGKRGSDSVGDGARYDPATNAWIPTSNIGAPDPRNEHTAIWTGDEMIVWGGRMGESTTVTTYFNTGGRYRPDAVPETCNGIDDDCNGVIDDGVSCDDGNPCNGVETCGGALGCLAGTPLECDDGNPCNGVETCNPATGCVSGTPLTCNDGNACNGVETCNPATGCVAGTALICNDDNACNGVETCNPATGCVAGTPLVCSDGNACNGVETCNPATGCVAGTPVVCTASDQCHDVGICDHGTGVCSNPNKANGVTCDDGNSSTTNDTCQGGVCIGGSSCATKPTPKSVGYYKNICDRQTKGTTHFQDDVITDADAQCVGQLTASFAGISTAADVCNVIGNDHHNPPHGDGPDGPDCDKAEDELMALALNICRNRVCTDQEVDSDCGENHNTLTTVGASLHTADQIVGDPNRDKDTCKNARCLAQEINNGHGLHHTALTADKLTGNIVKLTWIDPIMADGTGEATSYDIWRRARNTDDAFTQIGTTGNLSFKDTSAGSGEWEYTVTYTLQN